MMFLPPAAWTSHRIRTPNTIFRNPDWRRGSLRISADDAAGLQLTDGGKARLVTETGAATVTIELSDMMRAGNVALPNGLGLDCPTGDGSTKSEGVSPNELTGLGLKGDFAGTPRHKHVPARLESPAESAHTGGGSQPCPSITVR